MARRRRRVNVQSDGGPWLPIGGSVVVKRQCTRERRILHRRSILPQRSYDMDRGRSFRTLECKGHTHSPSAMFLCSRRSTLPRTFHAIGSKRLRNRRSCAIPIRPSWLFHVLYGKKHVWIFVVRAFPSSTFARPHDARQSEPSSWPLRCHVSYVPPVLPPSSLRSVNAPERLSTVPHH